MALLQRKKKREKSGKNSSFRLFLKDYANTYENLLEKSQFPSLKIPRLRIAVETFKIIHKFL